MFKSVSNHSCSLCEMLHANRNEYVLKNDLKQSVSPNVAYLLEAQRGIILTHTHFHFKKDYLSALHLHPMCAFVCSILNLI